MVVTEGMTTGAPAPEFNFKRELLAAMPTLRAFAISLAKSPDRADDLVQEAIMKAWGNQTSFRPGTNMKAWLFTILRNEFYSQMRKRGREVQDSEGYFTNSLSTHPQQHGVMDLDDFQAALAQISVDQREALILVGASGFDYEEAAQICGCAVGTIKSRVSRARARLHEILGLSGEGEFGPDSLVTQVTTKAVTA